MEQIMNMFKHKIDAYSRRVGCM